MIDVHIPANLFYPELPGGSNQYFRYGPYLRDRGVQLIVHTVHKPHHQEMELEVAGIKLRRYELPADSSLSDELELVTTKAIKAIEAGGGDSRACIHPLGTTGVSARHLTNLWKAKLKGIPSCFHFMMTAEESRASDWRERLKEKAKHQVRFSAYARLLMCSKEMGRVFSQTTGISNNRIEVIPNGIDLGVFSPVDESEKLRLRQELSLPEEAPLVLFVGSVIERKGVDLLVRAWEKVHASHPRARLVVVGSTRPRPTVRGADATESERYFNRVAEQVAALPDPESVIFAGETERIRDYYRASDLFAFASLQEGLPSVILEAMGCGVPCVTAPFIGLPGEGEEYGIDGEHFVKSSHDPLVLASDIERLLENKELRLEMGRRACVWIRETQEMGRAADRLAGVYHEMVGNRGR